MDQPSSTFRWLEPTFFQRWWPWRTASSKRRSLLRLIAVATDQRLPLAPLIEAWAADERGAQRRRVRRLSALLHRGVPLADAVEEVTGALREVDVLAIRFGAQSGTLSASLHAALTDAAAPRPTQLARGSITYLAVMALVITLIVTFIYIKIIPAFHAILEDYSLQPTPAMNRAIDFSRMVERYWWVIAAMLLLLAWSAVSARPGRFVRDRILGKLFGPSRALRSAEVLETLGVAATAGRPLAGAISTLARYHFDPTTRRKLLFVRNEMEQGAPIWSSMAGVGLLTNPEEKVLAMADQIGNRPWILRQLAAGKKRRTWRKLERLSELLLPAIVVLLGAFVLFQALALITPLIQMIFNLTA